IEARVVGRDDAPASHHRDRDFGAVGAPGIDGAQGTAAAAARARGASGAGQEGRRARGRDEKDDGARPPQPPATTTTTATAGRKQLGLVHRIPSPVGSVPWDLAEDRMSHELVVTAIGPDRPGLASEFAGHVLGAGANLADSRMVNLRGQFAILALVEG